jgi:hypothetical protein
VTSVPTFTAFATTKRSPALVPPEMDALVASTTKDPNAKITVLLFSDNSERPTLVLKVPTTEAAADAVRAEAHVIARVTSQLSPELRATVPRLIDVVDRPRPSTLLTTGVAGRPMRSDYQRPRHTASRRLVRQDFARASRWITRLHEATCWGRAPVNLALDGQLSTRLQNRFADLPDMEQGLRFLQRSLDRLGGQHTPRTAVHGDYWFGNLLVDDGDVTGVVDWEHGTPRGEPLRDVIRFALSYALYLDRGTPAGRPVHGHSELRADGCGSGVRYAVTANGWFPNLLRGFIQHHLIRLGVDAALWRECLVAGIAEIAAIADNARFASQHAELLIQLAALRIGIE